MKLETLNSWNIISKEDAESYTKRWQEAYAINAFLFHQSEIEALISNPNNAYIRFYMGLKNKSSDSTTTNLEDIDMFAVGVNSSREDNISESSKNSEVYNFPMPCPSTCDTASPLMGDGLQTNKVCTTKNTQNFDSGVNPDTGKLLEIPFKEAFLWTLYWQERYDIKSFLFDIRQLLITMKRTETERVRIYFGMDIESDVYAIMVGVNFEGNDIIKQEFFVNKITPCSKDAMISNVCSRTSPLYHDGIPFNARS